jgi:hypothetical protein
VHERKKIAVQCEKRHGQSEVKICRDVRLVSEQTTIAFTEPQVSINHYKTKDCLKKTKDEKKETYYLTAGGLS